MDGDEDVATSSELRSAFYFRTHERCLLCSCLVDGQLRALVVFIMWLLWFSVFLVVVVSLRIYQYLPSVFSFVAQVSRS